ncbi:PQQ-binding-like beta-propeller repeat protein [Haloparvum sp. PAK95]|uniref:outer membrane protein assembly factor BamB family protein n=1 Tax=Haloparvum sp. PAK95 TaxID=3418962 RepID=UPI003D2F4C57
MRARTAVAVIVLLGTLGAFLLFGVGMTPEGGSLSEQWVSDTARENELNHHAVGVGPEGRVVVAPVAALPNSDVEITNTSCSLVRLAPDDGSTLWRASTTAEACALHALTQPAIADVDGDGGLEVVVTTTENALVTYDADTGNESWRVPLGSYGYGRPTVADVLPQEGPEVVTSTIRGNVVLVSGNGTLAWHVSLNETFGKRPSVWQRPIVSDVDADGSPEILLGTNRGPVLLAANGFVEWTGTTSADYVGTAQADDDSAIEVFAAGGATVRMLDGKTGEIEWERNVTSTRLRTVTDGDGDGTPEVYLGKAGGKVIALDGATGETEWSTTITTSSDADVLSPVLEDVNGDGTLEVIAVAETGTVTVLDASSGTELATYERNVPILTFATPADLDGDGSAEILVRYGDGRVVALEYEP